MIAFLQRLLAGGPPILSEATLRDVGGLAALHAASFRRGWTDGEIEQLLLDRAVLCHRAMAGKRLVGFIISRHAAGEAEILSVAVAKSWRSRGVAAQLLNLHLRRLAGLGVQEVFLEVDENNVPARRLYARARFTEVGRRPGYYRDSRGGVATALVLRRAFA